MRRDYTGSLDRTILVINPIRTMLALGPALIPCVWLLAGQWHDASPDQRAWLQLTTALAAVAAIPTARRHTSMRRIVDVIRTWGWVAAAGLLVMS